MSKYYAHGMVCELPTNDVIGNVYFNCPESKANIEKIMQDLGVKGFIEPNISHGNNLMEVNTLDVAENLNPWNGSYTKCDGIHVTRAFLKETNMAVFGRSADCMMLALISEEDVYLLHLSVASLNAGILEQLPADVDYSKYTAVAGPCISAECYSLFGDEYIKKNTCNFEKFHYNDDIYWEEEKLHVSIRGIAARKLKAIGVGNYVENPECTYYNKALGSNRRDGKNRQDNVILIY